MDTIKLKNYTNGLIIAEVNGETKLFREVTKSEMELAEKLLKNKYEGKLSQ